MGVNKEGWWYKWERAGLFLKGAGCWERWFESGWCNILFSFLISLTERDDCVTAPSIRASSLTRHLLKLASVHLQRARIARHKKEKRYNFSRRYNSSLLTSAELT